MAHTLYITLEPADSAQGRGWKFTVDGTNQTGFFHGRLREAGVKALSLAIGAGRAAVVLALPRAGRFWWQSRRFLLRGFDEVGQLGMVNVRLVQERFVAAERWRRRLERCRARLGWFGLPRVWPCVP